MSVERNKAIVRRYYEEAVAKGEFDVLRDHIGSDWTNHTPGMPDVTGPSGAQQINSAFLEAFADVRVTIGALIGEGDLVAIRFEFSGRHKGTFLGVDATGKDVSFTATAFHRVVDDKITDDWINFDGLGILEQFRSHRVARPSG